MPLQIIAIYDFSSSDLMHFYFYHLLRMHIRESISIIDTYVLSISTPLGVWNTLLILYCRCLGVWTLRVEKSMLWLCLPCRSQHSSALSRFPRSPGTARLHIFRKPTLDLCIPEIYKLENEEKGSACGSAS